MKDDMHFGASSTIFQHAQFLRANQTETEKLLWAKLRKNGLGVKFRRQHPIGDYVVDFYCHKHMLAVELDGEYHDSPGQQELDAAREGVIAELGIKVLRFTDAMVLEDIDKVIDQIEINLTTDRPM